MFADTRPSIVPSPSTVDTPANAPPLASVIACQTMLPVALTLLLPPFTTAANVWPVAN